MNLHLHRLLSKLRVVWTTLNLCITNKGRWYKTQQNMTWTEIDQNQFISSIVRWPMPSENHWLHKWSRKWWNTLALQGILSWAQWHPCFFLRYTLQKSVVYIKRYFNATKTTNQKLGDSYGICDMVIHVLVIQVEWLCNRDYASI